MTEVFIISTKLDLFNLFDTKTYNICKNELYTTIYNSNFTFFTKIHSFFSLIIFQLELLFDYVSFVPSWWLVHLFVFSFLGLWPSY